MASSLKDNNIDGGNPASRPSTTFVQADPSNFRAVVQKLTGATTTIQQPSTTHKQLISPAHVTKPTFSEVIGHRKSGHNYYKLHERRKAGRKLEITLNKLVARPPPVKDQRALIIGYGGGDVEAVRASPVSTLDVCGSRSPGTPTEEEEEEKAIAEKGFYLHPSPIGGSEPELLVLFPLSSPKNDPSIC